MLDCRAKLSADSAGAGVGGGRVFMHGTAFAGECLGLEHFRDRHSSAS